VRTLTETLLAAPHDLEDMAARGRQLHACPYYAARRAAAAAEARPAPDGGGVDLTARQVVTVPYQALFHPGTRAALGLRLRGAVVLVDEAHNIVPAINAMHSVELATAQVPLPDRLSPTPR
jgi:chromosome transmission fidelity protein 1